MEACANSPHKNSIFFPACYSSKDKESFCKWQFYFVPEIALILLGCYQQAGKFKEAISCKTIVFPWK